jgi:hypothetical protein
MVHYNCLGWLIPRSLEIKQKTFVLKGKTLVKADFNERKLCVEKYCKTELVLNL